MKPESELLPTLGTWVLLVSPVKWKGGQYHFVQGNPNNSYDKLLPTSFRAIKFKKYQVRARMSGRKDFINQRVNQRIHYQKLCRGPEEINSSSTEWSNPPIANVFQRKEISNSNIICILNVNGRTSHNSQATETT